MMICLYDWGYGWGYFQLWHTPILYNCHSHVCLGCVKKNVEGIYFNLCFKFVLGCQEVKYISLCWNRVEELRNGFIKRTDDNICYRLIVTRQHWENSQQNWFKSFGAHFKFFFYFQMLIERAIRWHIKK